MSDQDFLQMYVTKFNLIHSKNTYAAILDVNYKYVAVSHGASTLLKKNDNTLLSVDDHIGINFIDDLVRPDWIKFKKTEIFINTANTGLPHNYIAITPSEKFTLDSMLLCVCPIKNPCNGQVVGFDLTGSEVLSRMGLQLNNLKNITGLNNIFYKLTAHELDILYFKCQFYSDNQVSQILESIYNRKISPKTINNILRQQLYPKFNVVSMVDLVKKAKSYGIANLNLCDVSNKDGIITLPSNMYFNFTNSVIV